MSQQVPCSSVPQERNILLRVQKISKAGNTKIRSGIIERYTYKTDKGNLLPNPSLNVHFKSNSNNKTIINSELNSNSKTNLLKRIDHRYSSLSQKVYKTGNSSRENCNKTVRTEDCDSTTDIIENVKYGHLFLTPKIINISDTIAQRGSIRRLSSSQPSDTDSDCQIIDVDNNSEHPNKTFIRKSTDSLTKKSEKQIISILNLNNILDTPNTKVINWIARKEKVPESIIHVISDESDDEEKAPKTTSEKNIRRHISVDLSTPSSSKFNSSSTTELDLSKVIVSSKLKEKDPIALINEKYQLIKTQLNHERNSLISTPSKLNVITSPPDSCSDVKKNVEASPPPKQQKLTPQKCNAPLSPESMKSEFYNYLKINTNPSALKTEKVSQNRRSTRVKKMIQKVEKKKESTDSEQKRKKIDIRKKYMKYNVASVIFPAIPSQFKSVSNFDDYILSYFNKTNEKTELSHKKSEDSAASEKYFQDKKKIKLKMRRKQKVIEYNLRLKDIQLRRLRFKPNRMMRGSVRITRTSLDGHKIIHSKKLKRKNKVRKKIEQNKEVLKQMKEAVKNSDVSSIKTKEKDKETFEKDVKVFNILKAALENPDVRSKQIPSIVKTKEKEINENENFHLKQKQYEEKLDKVVKKTIEASKNSEGIAKQIFSTIKTKEKDIPSIVKTKEKDLSSSVKAKETFENMIFQFKQKQKEIRSDKVIKKTKETFRNSDISPQQVPSIDKTKEKYTLNDSQVKGKNPDVLSKQVCSTAKTIETDIPSIMKEKFKKIFENEGSQYKQKQKEEKSDKVPKKLNETLKNSDVSFKQIHSTLKTKEEETFQNMISQIKQNQIESKLDQVHHKKEKEVSKNLNISSKQMLSSNIKTKEKETFELELENKIDKVHKNTIVSLNSTKTKDFSTIKTKENEDSVSKNSKLKIVEINSENRQKVSTPVIEPKLIIKEVEVLKESKSKIVAIPSSTELKHFSIFTATTSSVSLTDTKLSFKVLNSDKKVEPLNVKEMKRIECKGIMLNNLKRRISETNKESINNKKMCRSISPVFYGFPTDEQNKKPFKILQHFISSLDTDLLVTNSLIQTPEPMEHFVPEIQINSIPISNEPCNLQEMMSIVSSDYRPQSLLTPINEDESSSEYSHSSSDPEESNHSELIQQQHQITPQLFNTELIERANPNIIPLNQNIKPKSFHRSLMQTTVKRKSALEMTRSSLFELSDSDSSIIMSSPKGSKKSLTHEIDIYERNGPVYNSYYVNGILIIVQELLITFWKQTALGNILGAQNMWLPYGNVQRISLERGCINKRSSEMVLCAENAIAYIELWTKEHESMYRECPIADVFATIYFHRGHGMPDKKVLQLENIKGYGNVVRFAVIRNSREIIVSWCDTFSKPIKTMVRSYELAPDFQSISSVKEMESVHHYISSLHNIHDCDDLMLGSGNDQISVWNLKHGYLVTTLSLAEGPISSPLESKTLCLYAQCDAGFLFLIQQFEVGMLRLVAVNGMTQEWKQLHSYQVPANYKQLLGIVVESGILMTCYTNGFLCWNINNGQLLAEIETQNEEIVLPTNNYLVSINNYHVTVQHIISYILQNW